MFSSIKRSLRIFNGIIHQVCFAIVSDQFLRKLLDRISVVFAAGRKPTETIPTQNRLRLGRDLLPYMVQIHIKSRVLQYLLCVTTTIKGERHTIDI